MSDATFPITLLHKRKEKNSQVCQHSTSVDFAFLNEASRSKFDSALQSHQPEKLGIVHLIGKHTRPWRKINGEVIICRQYPH